MWYEYIFRYFIGIIRIIELFNKYIIERRRLETGALGYTMIHTLQVPIL